MKKLILFLTAISFCYIAVSQCVVSVSNDSTLQCGTQMNLKIQSGSSGNTYNAVFFTDEDHGYVVGNNGICLMTQNGGAYWFTPYTTFSTDLTDICFLTPDIRIYCGE
ncbi:MAG TPA: hypothetical protein PLI77_08440 [Bacteroidales bacterium]|nr:hypothetical protein [Bacteroidales bacterium]